VDTGYRMKHIRKMFSWIRDQFGFIDYMIMEWKSEMDNYSHEWQVSETEHPFMTGYTCRKCDAKCGVLDTEKPYSDAECIPKDKS